jgi:hypothetical protein
MKKLFRLVVWLIRFTRRSVAVLSGLTRAPPREAVHKLHKAEPCVTYFGNRGSGKTEALKNDLLELARKRHGAVVLFDVGNCAWEMAGHLTSRGYGSRLIYEEAARMDAMVSWPFLRAPPDATDSNDLNNKIEVAGGQFSAALWSKRNLKSGEGSPWTKAWADNATAVFLGLPIRPPIAWILRLFEPDTPEHDWMLDHSTAQEAVMAFRRIEALRVRFANSYDAQTSPAYRLMRILRSPSVGLRDGDSLDWQWAIKNKMQVYFDLRGLTDECARALTIFGYNAVLNAVVKLFEKTHKEHPVTVVLEEAGKLGTVTPLLLDGARAWRKAGFSVWTVSQTVEDFTDKETVETLLALADVHKWFRLNSGIERAAKDLATPTFDRTDVSHQRTKQVHDGTEEVKLSDDRIALTSKYREETEDVLKTPQVHDKEWAEALSNLQTGECLERSPTGVTKTKVPFLGLAWLYTTLNDLKTRRAIEELRKRLVNGLPLFRPPVPFRLPPPLAPPPPPPATPSPPPPPSPVPVAPVPPGTPTSTGILRRRATLRSKRLSPPTP